MLLLVILSVNNKKVERLVGVMIDITERKVSEEKIRLSEEKYRLLAENMDDVIWKIDVNSLTYTYFSPSVFKLTGYSVEEAMQLSLEKILLPDSFEELTITISEWIEQFNQGIPGSRSKNFEFQIRHKDGHAVWVEVNAIFITDNNGVIKEIEATSRNIEERKVSEIRLRESEEKLKTIFNTSKDGIVLFNREMKILEINQSALKKTAYSREELIGKSAINTLLKEEVSEIIEHAKNVWTNNAIVDFETEIVYKDGHSIPAEITASVVHIENQEALLLMIRDLSERKRLEKELLRSIIKTEENERIHFSQELHDGLGPLLSAAKMYVEWLAELDSESNSKNIIRDIQKLLEDSNQSIRDISFKLSPHILQNYGMVEALKAYSEKLSKSLKAGIIINSPILKRFDEITETVIYRVICECINNTIKHANAQQIIINFQVVEKILTIDYTDDGKGFDVEMVKASRKGIGLLNMQSRLKSINGQFSIESALKKGCRISIKVPLIE